MNQKKKVRFFMNKNNSPLPIDFFKILFPQVVYLLVTLASVYLAFQGHAGISIFSSFFFLIFYGIVALPMYIFTVLGIFTESNRIIFDVLSSLYGILVPLIFCVLSIFLLFRISSGRLHKRKLIFLAKLHFVIGSLLYIILNHRPIYQFFKFPNFDNIGSTLFVVFVTGLLTYVVWATLLNIAKQRFEDSTFKSH